MLVGIVGGLDGMSSLSEMLEMPSTYTPCGTHHQDTSFPQKTTTPMVVPLSINRNEKYTCCSSMKKHVVVYGTFRGWWFSPYCMPSSVPGVKSSAPASSNLNGVWHADCASNPPNSGIQWHTWKGSNYSLYEVSMKIRPGIMK